MERDNKAHKVQTVNSKLQCDCEEDKFVGIPCRHQVAIFVKRKIDFQSLPFNPRWQKSYYEEKLDLADPAILEHEEKSDFADLTSLEHDLPSTEISVSLFSLKI